MYLVKLCTFVSKTRPFPEEKPKAAAAFPHQQPHSDGVTTLLRCDLGCSYYV
jgi:hypothetical protein